MGLSRGQLLPGAHQPSLKQKLEVWTHERQNESENQGGCVRPSSPGGSVALPAAAPVRHAPPHGPQGDPGHQHGDAEVAPVPFPARHTGE